MIEAIEEFLGAINGTARTDVKAFVVGRNGLEETFSSNDMSGFDVKAGPKINNFGWRISRQFR